MNSSRNHQEFPFFCIHCNKGCENWNLLKHHEINCQKGSDNTQEAPQISGRNLPSTDSSKLHQRKINMQINKEVRDQMNQRDKHIRVSLGLQKPDPAGKMLVCKTCDGKFPNSKSLKQHISRYGQWRISPFFSCGTVS